MACRGGYGEPCKYEKKALKIADLEKDLRVAQEQRGQVFDASQQATATLAKCCDALRVATFKAKEEAYNYRVQLTCIIKVATDDGGVDYFADKSAQNHVQRLLNKANDTNQKLSEALGVIADIAKTIGVSEDRSPQTVLQDVKLLMGSLEHRGLKR